MNLSDRQLQFFRTSEITLRHPSLSPPRFLSLPISSIPHESKPSLKLHRPSAASILPPCSSTSVFEPLRRFRCLSFSETEAQIWGNQEEEEEESDGASTESEDLSPNGLIHQKTLRLVECSMFAAVTGLAYFLSNSLQIENYLGCFFAFPIVLTSLRWGVAAGRKNMVATAVLLLVLSGPVKAITYLLLHGSIGLTMGTLWWLGANWWLSIFLSAFARVIGSFGYLWMSSFLIRENILGVICASLHASLTYALTAMGINTTPSMNAVYTIFCTLLMLNCGFFVFLLHILYSVFVTRLGMKVSLSLPGWLEKSM